MRSLAMTWLVALALTGCSPKPQPAAPAPKPAVSDFSKDMDAHGTEPFWGLKMRGAQFTLSRPDTPDLVATAPGATITPGKAVWVAKTTDGRDLTVTMYVSACSDGMSDVSYPLTVEIDAPDISTLTGCGARVAAPAGRAAPNPAS